MVGQWKSRSDGDGLSGEKPQGGIRLSDMEANFILHRTVR